MLKLNIIASLPKKHKLSIYIGKNQLTKNKKKCQCVGLLATMETEIRRKKRRI